MMRALLLLSFFAAAPVLAQEAPGDTLRSVLVVSADSSDASERATPQVFAYSARGLGAGSQLALVALGMAGSLGLLVLADRAPALLFLAPVTSGLAVYSVGEALGHDSDLLRTMGGAALGAVPGLVLIGIGVEIDRRSSSDALLGEGFGLIVLGALAYMTGPAMGATVGYSIGVGVQPTPDARPIPTLNLRVGL